MLFRTLGCLAVLSGAWKHRGGGVARSTHNLHFAALDKDRVEMPETHRPGVHVLNMLTSAGSLRPQPASADPIADGLRREPDSVDAEPEPAIGVAAAASTTRS
jgi:hypothetical protein